MGRIRSTKRAGTDMADRAGEPIATGSPLSLASVLSDVAHLLVQEGSPATDHAAVRGRRELFKLFLAA